MMVSKGSTRSPELGAAVIAGATERFPMSFTFPRFMAPILSPATHHVNGKSDWSQSISVNCS